MHAPHPHRLYSPANFFLGCQLTLTSRTVLTPSQAIRELRPAAPKSFGAVATLLFAVLAGVAMLVAVVRVLGRTAPAAMEQAAPALSAYWLALLVALLVFMAFCWLMLRGARAATRFYATMCQRGHAYRMELATRSPTVRCYTSQD